MTAYYNEFDHRAAAWLRELIKEGLIADGEVDERSISDVQPADLVGYDQCHFFAGIGGWSYALRLAGWPDDRPVWTGSCPCQPFSSAGKQLGTADPRHLAPTWLRLIGECRPPVIFGEQVANAIGKGWLDALFISLEDQDYACGAAVLPACSVGAPHKRDRVWFVADSDGRGCGEQCERDSDPPQRATNGRTCWDDAGGRDSDGRMAYRKATGWDAWRHGVPGSVWEKQPCGSCDASGVAYLDITQLEGRSGAGCSSERSAGTSGMDESEGSRGCRREQAGHAEPGRPSEGCCVADAGCIDSPRRRDVRHLGSHASEDQREGHKRQWDGDAADHSGWNNVVWLTCRDGKLRPTQPGLFPLADGLPGRVGLLRGYGNAIVPQVAAEFIAAYEEARGIR